MPKKDDRVKDIVDSIQELFGDTSVPKRKTLEWMEEILDSVSGSVSALREDLKREEGDEDE